jgi:hypothetical protein
LTPAKLNGSLQKGPPTPPDRWFSPSATSM